MTKKATTPAKTATKPAAKKVAKLTLQVRGLFVRQIANATLVAVDYSNGNGKEFSFVAKEDAIAFVTANMPV